MGLTDFEKTEKLFSEIGVSFNLNTLPNDFINITILDKDGYGVADLYFNKPTGKYENCD